MSLPPHSAAAIDERGAGWQRLDEACAAVCLLTLSRVFPPRVDRDADSLAAAMVAGRGAANNRGASPDRWATAAAPDVGFGTALPLLIESLLCAAPGSVGPTSVGTSVDAVRARSISRPRRDRRRAVRPCAPFDARRNRIGARFVETATMISAGRRSHTAIAGRGLGARVAGLSEARVVDRGPRLRRGSERAQHWGVSRSVSEGGGMRRHDESAGPHS